MIKGVKGCRDSHIVRAAILLWAQAFFRVAKEWPTVFEVSAEMGYDHKTFRRRHLNWLRDNGYISLRYHQNQLVIIEDPNYDQSRHPTPGKASKKIQG